MHRYKCNPIVADVTGIGDTEVVTLRQNGHPKTFWRASLAPSWAAHMVAEHGPCENRAVGPRHLVVAWGAYGKTMTRSCCPRAATALEQCASNLGAAG